MRGVKQSTQREHRQVRLMDRGILENGELMFQERRNVYQSRNVLGVNQPGLGGWIWLVG